jgi:hypothetical protein
MSHSPPPEHPEHPYRLFRAHFATDEAVYGVILVSGIIVAAGAHGGSVTDVLFALVPTMLIFWAAHVYAGTVAHHGLDVEPILGLGASFRLALERSWGLLVASMIPTAILLIGLFEGVADGTAIWLALWAGVVLLAILGYLAFYRRRAHWGVCVLGSLGTAAFGILMIVLKSALH